MQAASKEREILENMDGFYVNEDGFTKHNSKVQQYYGECSHISQKKDAG